MEEKATTEQRREGSGRAARRYPGEERTRAVDAEVPSWAVPGEFKGQQEMSQREEEADR